MLLCCKKLTNVIFLILIRVFLGMKMIVTENKIGIDGCDDGLMIINVMRIVTVLMADDENDEMTVLYRE